MSSSRPSAIFSAISPTALRHYPQYAATRSSEAHQALLDAGFPSGSEPIWEYSYRAFCDNFQRILREELDPAYYGDLLPVTPSASPSSGSPAPAG